jgi:OOP family OmpA-OmpF porin
MSTNPKIRIRLEGHTDNIGSYQYNLGLSLSRVESVAKYLIYKGIDSGRIELAGFSFRNPIATNETDEGRQLNRRVVFKILDK